MEEARVHRLIFVTASHDHPDLPWIFQTFIRPAFMNKVFEDMERQDAFFKNYRGPVQFTNLRPMKFSDGKRYPGKEKHTLSNSPESVGWTFEIHIDYLTEVLIECWKKNLYINKLVDLGSCK